MVMRHGNEITKRRREMSDIIQAIGPVRSFDVFFRKETNTPGSYTFVKVGIAFENDKGQIGVTLDALPVGKWDGRLTLFPHKEKEGKK